MNKEQLIEKAIKETLVIENHESIHIAVKRIIDSLNTRTESKPIQVSEPVNIEGEYWDAKQVIENPKDYHKQTVYDAGNFIRGYELALSQQPEVSQEYFDKMYSILDDSEGWKPMNKEKLKQDIRNLLKELQVPESLLDYGTDEFNEVIENGYNDNTRTESRPIQVSDAMIEKQFPLYQEQRIKQTGGHYEVIPSINYLNQAKQTGAKWALSQQSEVSQEYFDKIHSILDDSEGWVSVDDRLPEINKPVLIFAKYGKQATARRTGELWIDLMRTQHSYGSITHWQHYLTHLKNKIMAQITTIYEYPPIPIRDYDWSAIRKDYEGGDLIGHGRTAQDAIEDLINQEENK